MAWLPGAPEIEVELIANGRPIAVQKVRANGELRTLTFADPKLIHSVWLAVRTFPSAHTNPLWVTVDDQPVRVKESIAWCLASLEQCWKEKQRTYAVEEMKQAKADYEHARLTYRRLLDEASR